MKNEWILLAVVLAPLLGSCFLPLMGLLSARLRNIISLLLVLVSFSGSLLLAPVVLSGGTVLINHPSLIGSCFFQADKLAVFMALVSSLVGAIIVFYSFGYISHYECQDEYYFMVVLFLGSMMGLVYSGNLLLIYLFWEITAIACWRLIGFFREKSFVFRADKAFLVTVFGALVMLLGFIMVYQQTGSFDMAAIKAALSYNSISDTAVLLILFGILSKSATLPLHTWLPDAGVAPSPVTALLHAAVLVKIGVYVYARLFVVTMPPAEIWHTVIPAIAAASALVSAGAALIDRDMKRIIAYSTISQIGFIFLGLSIGNGIGIAGGLLYILMHGIAKGGLFLCAGIVEQKTHIKDITLLGGLARVMPVTAVSFLLCAFSVMGIPPFGGFFSKYMVITGAVNHGNMWITGAFVLGAFMTIIYLFRIFNAIFMGEMKVQPAGEGSAVMLWSVAILAGLSLVSGLMINYPAQFVQSTVQQMLGMVAR